jgi:hypothetical protein
MQLRIPPFVYAFVLLLAVGFLACGPTAESHVPVVIPEATVAAPDTSTSDAYVPSRHQAFLTKWCKDALNEAGGLPGASLQAGEAMAECIRYLASVRE